jgi:SpoIID/LytB domain protein
MGQYGAAGMANRGVGYQDILKHYYAGIAFATRAPENIRVLLQTSSDLLATSAATFTATSGSSHWSSTSAQPYRRVTQGNGTYTLWSGASPSRSGTWTKVATTAASIVFRPGTQMLQFVQPSGTFRYYRGSISAVASGSSSLLAINVVPLEQYLAGVVPREMPASWRANALQAQAVAARSYTINKKLRSASSSYDICTTTFCQVYGGYAYKAGAAGSLTVLESSNSTNAINATAGKVMTVGGTPILAEYSSSTGGYTAQGTVSYESSVADPDDSISPYHDWTTSVSVRAIEQTYPSIGRLVALTITSRDGHGDWGGRVRQLSIVGTTATQTVSGSSFASTFGLRTNYFTVQTWNAELAQTPGPLSVFSGKDLPVRIFLKNSGTATWPLNSYVRITSTSSSLSGPEWISPTRPAAVSKDATNSARTSVPPGDVGEFDFTLHTSTLAPGNYNQRFSVIADGVSVMNPAFTIPFTVASPHTMPGIVSGDFWSLNMGFKSTTDISIRYGLASDVKLVGDWTGHGVFTPGAVRGNVWYLSNGFSGHTDISFRYGIPGDIPIVGDWDGNGTYTPGLIRGSTWILSNSFNGHSDISFRYGLSTDRFLVGDWNGDGKSTPGAVRGNTWYLSNGFTGQTFVTFKYGLATDTPIAGDWDGSGTWTPGVVRGKSWYIREGFGQSGVAFTYGDGSGVKITGTW